MQGLRIPTGNVIKLPSYCARSVSFYLKQPSYSVPRQTPNHQHRYISAEFFSHCSPCHRFMSSSRIMTDSNSLNYLSLGSRTDAKHKRKSEELRTISLEQLSRHDRYDDCWVAIYDRVYDCTEFIKTHPGGQDVILEYAGRDATLAFIGAGHTQAATGILKNYLVGQLPIQERLFLVPNGIKIVTIA